MRFSTKSETRSTEADNPDVTDVNRVSVTDTVRPIRAISLCAMVPRHVRSLNYRPQLSWIVVSWVLIHLVVSQLAEPISAGRGLLWAFGMWARWFAMHGVARAFVKVRRSRERPVGPPHRRSRSARRSLPVDGRDPGARTAGAHAVHLGQRRPRRMPRSIARQTFRVTAPSAMDVPRPLRTLITRTEDEGVANPVEPPAMVGVDPPEHTRIDNWCHKASLPAPSRTSLPASTK